MSMKPGQEEEIILNSADRRIDTMGLYCPIPIIRTAAVMGKMKRGETLEVISSDRVILVDMPAWCRSTGNGYLGSRNDGEREFHLFVRKGLGSGTAGEKRNRK